MAMEDTPRASTCTHSSNSNTINKTTNDSSLGDGNHSRNITGVSGTTDDTPSNNTRDRERDRERDRDKERDNR